MMRKRALLALGVLAMLALVGCYGGSRPKHIGDVAPDFTLQDSDRKITLSDFRGQVVVLNIWASWCPPCVEETPALIAMQQKLKDRGVTIVAVSIDEDADAYHRFVKEHGINFVTVRDPDRKTANLYGTFGWPETYIIDRKGVIRRKFIGAADWTSPEIIGFLTNL
jgi:peroxiredoxin